MTIRWTWMDTAPEYPFLLVLKPQATNCRRPTAPPPSIAGPEGPPANPSLTPTTHGLPFNYEHIAFFTTRFTQPFTVTWESKANVMMLSTGFCAQCTHAQVVGSSVRYYSFDKYKLWPFQSDSTSSTEIHAFYSDYFSYNSRQEQII